MLEISDSRIETASAHLVGNKHHEEELTLSTAPLDLSNEDLTELLKNYFLGHFTQPDFQSFTGPEGELSQNPLYAFAQKIFAGEGDFHEQSREVAQHLFECSDHPNVKSGELFVVLLRDIVVEDELTDAIGIFKSEVKRPFLQLQSEGGELSLNFDHGISTEKLDKGCLVLNLSSSTGYKLCVVDKTSKGEEARYWKDRFLQVRPCADNYHFTEDVLKVTKKFVTSKAMQEEYDVEKADQLGFLNSSVKYFKDKDTFNEQEYASEVFQNEEISEGFQQFRQAYQEANDLPAAEEFDISEPAVKKQSRYLRSVLKLDKNFHVYVHGDRQLIEKGYDDVKGKSFYKIYFDEEK